MLFLIIHRTGCPVAKILLCGFYVVVKVPKDVFIYIAILGANLTANQRSNL